MTTLLLDVDGTLIDSFTGIRAGFLHALNQVGWPAPPEEQISKIAGPPMEETMANLGLDQPTIRRAFDAYMEYTRNGGWAEAQAYPGMKVLLEQWRADGFRLITATSKGEGFARAILEREGMLDLFEFIGAAEEYGTRRDKKSVIQYVFDSVDLAAERAAGAVLMVGDRSHDIEGAAAFGLDTCAVTWGYGNSSEWTQAKYVAGSPEELDQTIRNFHAAH